MSLDQLCQSWLDLKWHFDPAGASAAGALEHDGRLGEYDADSIRVHLAGCRALAAALEELEIEDTQEEIDRTALLDELRVTVIRLANEAPHRRNPAFWLGHLLNALHTLILRDVGDPVLRARGALARLDGAPGYLRRAEETLSQPPAVFVSLARDMLVGGTALVREVAREHGRRRPEMAADLAEAAERAAAALERFGQALDSEIVPDPDELAFAVGEDQFDRRLHHEHAIRHGAPELWRYGLHLVEEIEAEVAALAAQLEPGKPWRDVVERVRAERLTGDPVALFAGEADRARAFLVEQGLVALPDARLEVLPTPGFLRPLIPFAAYAPPGALFADRTGYFYVTPPEANGNGPPAPGAAAGDRRGSSSRHDVAITVAHEGFPGHHLHFGTIAALPSRVRRHVWTPVTIEGWALYSEELMAEQGFFRSREERLLQRVHLLWRAIRILLDVGLHTRGMRPAEAEEMLVAKVPIERAQAAVEVRRYCAWPTYQLSYAVGRRDILALREDRRRRDGAAFSLRDFHDDFLAYGGLPVSLIRWGMELEE
ncbi:MAG: DUF885 domain-containing protein [Gemmatimonadales bacterium]